MEVGKKKTISIFHMFLEYLIGFSVAVAVLIITALTAIYMAFSHGVILSANHTEEKLSHLEKTLSENFDKDLLPAYCNYIVIGNGIVIDSNMSKQEIAKTREVLSAGKRKYYEMYKEIPLSNGNIVLIQYDMLAHFSNPLFHKIIPYPELMFIIILLAVIVLFAIITARKFSKKLKRNLKSINTATEKIKDQDLMFEIEPTKIVEFNSSLDAIEKLKNALTDSLNQQWNEEENRKSQLSALTHDIKTPLSVIKGNVELLIEEEKSKEDKELLSYILNSSDIIESYLETLMGVVNNQSLALTVKNIGLNDFIQEVTAEILPLCITKNIKLIEQIHAKAEEIQADAGLLKRALINVADNAVRFSPKNSQIDFNVWDNETDIHFEIIDYGKGFSEQSIRKATQEFYTEDISRTNKNYGLGLSFVKKVVELHNGFLTIENNAATDGAKVTITIKL